MTEKYVFDEKTVCIRINKTACGSHDYVVFVATPDGKYAASCFFDGDRKTFIRTETASENCKQAIAKATTELRKIIGKDNTLLLLKRYNTAVFPDLNHAKHVNVQIEELK